MKEIKMFVTSWCPYCQKARLFMEELYEENPNYRNLKIQIIDEELETEVAKQYDYYYVPTFYLEDDKFNEGAIGKEKIKELFDAAK